MRTLKAEIRKLARVVHDFCIREESALRRMVCMNSFTENGEGVDRLGVETASWFQSVVDESLLARRHPSRYKEYGSHLELQKRGGNSTIAMISHLDTVYPSIVEEHHSFQWEESCDEHGAWIVGPGSMDIKGGTFMIGAILHTLRTVFPDQYNSVNFTMLFNSSEEVMVDDFANVCTATLPSNSCLGCLVFEAGFFGERPSKNGKVEHELRGLNVPKPPTSHKYKLVTSRKGMAVWEVTLTGIAAHAGNAHAQGVNAIAAACSLALKLEALTSYDRGVAFNVGRIRGGTTHNTVPDSASLLVEMRAHDADQFENAQSAFQQAVLAVEKELQSRFELRGQQGDQCVVVEARTVVKPWCINEGTESLLRHWQRAAERLGQNWPDEDVRVWRNPFHRESKRAQGYRDSLSHPASIRIDYEARGGLSDGNWLWDRYPTIDGLGPHGEFAHVPGKERLHTSSFVPKAVLNCLGILELLHAHKHTAGALVG